MLLELAVAALVGAALGAKLEVYVLVPAVLIFGTIAAALGLSSGAGPWRIALDSLLAAATLQFSFMAGAAVSAPAHSGQHEISNGAATE